MINTRLKLKQLYRHILSYSQLKTDVFLSIQFEMNEKIGASSETNVLSTAEKITTKQLNFAMSRIKQVFIFRALNILVKYTCILIVAQCG